MAKPPVIGIYQFLITRKEQGFKAINGRFSFSYGPNFSFSGCPVLPLKNPIISLPENILSGVNCRHEAGVPQDRL